MRGSKMGLDVQRTAQRKQRFPKLEVHVGCSGWFYWHWKGSFYPAEIPTHTWFKHYLKHFKTVELNAPFYSWPKVATVKNWRRNAPEAFRYSVKVNGSITHDKRMVRTKRLVKSFYFIAEILGPQLGCFLFQFPPSYRYTPSRLKSIVAQLDPAYQNAVEFRHKSWWRPAVYRAFEKRGLTFCSISAPKLPDDLVKTGDTLYLRFHGVSRWYRHDYTKAELATWANRIQASGAAKVWVYFNNDREGYAIKNAKLLRRLLTKPASTIPKSAK